MSNYPMTDQAEADLSVALERAAEHAGHVERLSRAVCADPADTSERAAEAAERLVSATRALARARSTVGFLSRQLVKAAQAEHGVTEEQARDYLDNLLPS